jgi:hypothetical protein
MNANTSTKLRELSTDELRAVEGGFFGSVVAWIRSHLSSGDKVDGTSKELEAHDRLGNFEIQDL